MRTIFITIALLFIGAQIVAGDDLFTGSGDATFYYDINGAGTCGPAIGVNDYPETDGFTMCEWNNPNPRSLRSYNTNNIVAMQNNILRDNLSNYCGKKVIVSINGNERSDLNLFIWDGCEACNGNGGLDFSASIFGELFGEDRCGEGRISNELTWRIVDEQIENFVSG